MATRGTKKTKAKTAKAVKSTTSAKKTRKTTGKRRTTKSKAVKSETSSSKSKAKRSELKIDMRPFMVPFAILLAGLMISCSVVIAFSGGDYSLPFGQKEELDCDSLEPLSKDCLKQYAQDIDIKYNDFKECLAEEPFDDAIESEIEAAQKYGAQGTPFVVIGVGKGDTFKGFYAGGAQGYDYYQVLIDEVKENGLEKAQENIKKEQLGTLEELIQRYKEAYQQQGLSGDELNEYAKSAAEEDFARLEIREFSIGEGHVVGSDDAEVVLMEFSDFECSYCKSFAQDTLVQIKKDYVDTDEIRFVFRDFPLEELHTKARRAANAARCAADQDKFIQYHDALFEVGDEE